MNNNFLTIIVRKDIEPGYKVTQTSHAIAKFAIEYEDKFKKWQYESEYLCCLELEIYKFDHVLSKLDELKIKYSVFREPDINNEITAIAVESINRELHKTLFKKFKLTLQ